MGFCAGVCGDREYARGNGLARATLHAAGPDRYGRRFGPMRLGGSVRRLVRLPAAISAPEPCRSGGACRIGDSVAFWLGERVATTSRTHSVAVENSSKGEVLPGFGDSLPESRPEGAVVGVTVGFHVSADGYRSGFSGARLLGAGLHVFMSGTDIFRFGRSG